MKKIGKLIINPEKVIKNEELVNLKGGSYSTCDLDAGLLCGGICYKISGDSETCEKKLLKVNHGFEFAIKLHVINVFTNGFVLLLQTTK